MNAATLKLHLLFAVLVSSPLVSAFIASGIAGQQHIHHGQQSASLLGAATIPSDSNTVTEAYAK